MKGDKHQRHYQRITAKKKKEWSDSIKAFNRDYKLWNRMFGNLDGVIGGNNLYTNLGNYLRKLRMERGELLYDIAKKVNISTPELSAIENGMVEVSKKFLHTIRDTYNLTPIQYQEMYENYSLDDIKVVRDYADLKRKGYSLSKILNA